MTSSANKYKHSGMKKHLNKDECKYQSYIKHNIYYHSLGQGEKRGG